MKNYYRNHKKGFIATIIFHLIVLALLLLCGFFTPLPLPGEQGILVSFGDSQDGSGRKEPASQKAEPVPIQKKKQEEPQPQPKVQEPEQKPSSKQVNQEVMTQDFEKTVALETAKKKEEEKKKQEEIARKKKEAEIQKKAEEELRKKKEEQQKINQINQLAQSAFGSSSKGDSDSKDTGKGVSFPKGNQGSPDGLKDSNESSQGPGGGKGISFSLDGRSALSLPKPGYPGNDEGLVVVQVTVDKYGNVTKAEPGFKGSNTILPELLTAAKKAALQAKFNQDSNAPAFQQGTITYRFILE